MTNETLKLLKLYTKAEQAPSRKKALKILKKANKLEPQNGNNCLEENEVPSLHAR